MPLPLLLGCRPPPPLGDSDNSVRYFVEGDPGVIRGYTDELSQQYAGANGAHRMKEALAVFNRVPRKFNDDGSITALPDDTMPLSNPNPTVTISLADFTALDTSYQTEPDVVQGNFTISGSIGSYLCDVTPGDQGKIDQVSIYLNTGDQPVVAQVQSSKGQGQAPRKYPFSGTFSATVPAKVRQGPNTLIVRVKDKIIGKMGSAEIIVDVRRDGAADPSPGREATGGFVDLSQPFFAEIDLATADPSGIESGTASLPVSVTNLLNPTRPVITDTVVKNGIRSLTLRGEHLGLRLGSGVLASAKAGQIDSFSAAVDCPGITWRERQVTFRRVAGSHFVSDYFSCTIVGDGGTDGNDPINFTLQRGGDGMIHASTLTKQGAAWQSANGDLTVLLSMSASSDGSRGITAAATSSSLGITAYSVQAVETVSAGTFTSATVVGVGDADGNDRESALGNLHSTYAEVAYSDTKEMVTPLAIEVDGPEEIIGKADFTLPTRSGDRKLAKRNDKYYLATSDGSEPESLMFVTKGDIPGMDVGVEPPKKDDPEPPKNGADAYLLGFGYGILGGGGALVGGAGDLLASVWADQVDEAKFEVDLILSWWDDEARDRAQEEVETKAAKAEAALAAAKAVTDVLVKIGADKLALYKAIEKNDEAEKERILGEYAIYSDLASEFFNELMDQHDALDDHHKGVVAGRIFFEAILIVLPLTKGAQAGQVANGAGVVSKVTVMTRLADKLDSMLGKFPLDLQPTLTRVIAKVRVIIQQMKGATWVAKYGRDGERIFTLKYHYQVRGGQTPLEAVASVEKNHKKLNQDALAAAYLEAVVEESGVAFVVRASDGARIPKLATAPNGAYFWSGRTVGADGAVFGGEASAAEIATANGGKTLEMVLGEKNLWKRAQPNNKVPEYAKEPACRGKVWGGLSEELAREASGRVYVVLGEREVAATELVISGQAAGKKTFWLDSELPLLLKNGKVTEIIAVDPMTRLLRSLFTRH